MASLIGRAFRISLRSPSDYIRSAASSWRTCEPISLHLRILRFGSVLKSDRTNVASDTNLWASLVWSSAKGDASKASKSIEEGVM